MGQCNSAIESNRLEVLDGQSLASTRNVNRASDIGGSVLA